VPLPEWWIEFKYQAGDRVSDLIGSVEDKWGGAASNSRWPSMPGSWALFCEQKDGAYLTLRPSDQIPVAPPEAAEEEVEKEGMAHHAFELLRRNPGTLDVFFLEDRYWERERGKPPQPRANYSMRLEFERKYKLPENQGYAVRLLALVAIVGG
jgi:hypothetical protein